MTSAGRWAIAAILLFACATSALAKDPLQPLRAQFALPQDRIDYAEAKLVVDTLIDPSTDVAAVRKALDRWESVVRANVPSGANPRQTFDALARTLYVPGPWNQHRPFAYDLDDPLGTSPATKRLSTYLETRRGNCVSMPMLVVILGQRLGLPVALATAPAHVFVKFRDAQQAWINFEATAGGFNSDASIVRKTGITPRAIDHGLYLRPLSPHEAVGVIASTLMEHHGAAGNAEALMEVADLALAANPVDPVAHVWKANAFYLQLEQRYVRRFPKASDIPPAQVADYRRLSRENLAWFAKAEALGWVQPTEAQRLEYLETVEREKARTTK